MIHDGKIGMPCGRDHGSGGSNLDGARGFPLPENPFHVEGKAHVRINALHPFRGGAPGVPDVVSEQDLFGCGGWI